MGYEPLLAARSELGTAGLKKSNFQSREINTAPQSRRERGRDGICALKQSVNEGFLFWPEVSAFWVPVCFLAVLIGKFEDGGPLDSCSLL